MPRSPDEVAAPIRLHSRQPVCENTVFSVFLDHVSGTGDHDVPRYLSVVPRHTTADGISGVGLLPIRAGKIGLIRVFRHPLARWSWEIPKGFVDAGETLEHAALRELAEETGYGVPGECLQPLGVVAPEAGVIKARIQVFAAALDGHVPLGGTANRELGHGKLIFYGRSEIAALAASGEIEDACTLAVLYLQSMRLAERQT